MSAGSGLTSVALAAWLLVHVTGAQALSLGRLNVQSALGEVLRAEIDVSSITPEEADTLRAALASPENFRAAGVDFNPALQNAQVTLAKRPDGRSVLRVTGDKAVTEPFVDLILDLSWNAGRLQRSYTLLIDPPIRSSAPTPAPAATTAPVMSPAPTAPAAAPAVPARPAARPAAAPAAPAAQAPADGYRVRSGDTLSSIASANARPGVSLDQMLVALYRGNPQAFVGSNMNRLKAGVVLDLAEAQAKAGETAPAEARRIIQAQSADFSSFRQRLAGAAPTVRSAEPARQAKGKVEAAVQDRKSDAAATPDQLKLSKGGAKAASAPEAKISKDTERQAAQARVAELTRNVEELKRLSASSAPPVAAAKPASTPTAVPPVAVAKPVEAPPAPPVAPPAPPAPPSAVASAAAPAASVAAPQASAPVAVASAPASAVAAPPAAAAAPVEESGLLDSLAENRFVLPLGVGLVALLTGWGAMRLRRRNQEGSGETSFIESKLQPDSFFGASGGQRVDTRDGPASAASSSLSYSLSQLDAIGDVDPVAEADVYLAYGRDLQAEEILKEALRGDPGRGAIRTKLLEVYAKRADARAFEQQAQQLHELTGGAGEDWARAAELGRQMDPENPLYALPEGAAEFTGQAVVEPEPAAAQPFSVPEATAPLDLPAAATAAAGPATGFDIDIDLDSPSQLSGLENTRPMTASPLPPDLGEVSVRGVLDEDMPVTRPSGFDEIDTSIPRTTPGALDEFFAEPRELPPSVPATPAPPAPAPRDAQHSGPVDFDFGDLSLDLGGVEGDAPPPPPASGDDLDAGAADPLQRKIELADEFRRIGDVEGARDLLQEVIEKADGALRARAQSLLDEL